MEYISLVLIESLSARFTEECMGGVIAKQIIGVAIH
jgi:hypothetical protein